MLGGRNELRAGVDRGLHHQVRGAAGRRSRVWGRIQPYYATATQALAAFQTKLASGGLVTAPLSSNIQDSSSYSPLIGPIEFTLSSPTSVNFFVADTPGQYGDNGGGVSLSITSATPLPPALPLFATGLGIAGLLGWRTKRNNEPASAT